MEIDLLLFITFNKPVHIEKGKVMKSINILSWIRKN